MDGLFISGTPLQIKKDYLQGATDTVDLVPIGAYYGKHGI